MADLMELRAEQKRWCEDRMLSPDGAGCAAMEEFLFWVGTLHRWVSQYDTPQCRDQL
jgi:hypothetical protein